MNVDPNATVTCFVCGYISLPDRESTDCPVCHDTLLYDKEAWRTPAGDYTKSRIAVTKELLVMECQRRAAAGRPREGDYVQGTNGLWYRKDPRWKPLQQVLGVTDEELNRRLYRPVLTCWACGYVTFPEWGGFDCAVCGGEDTYFHWAYDATSGKYSESALANPEKIIKKQNWAKEILEDDQREDDRILSDGKWYKKDPLWRPLCEVLEEKEKKEQRH